MTATATLPAGKTGRIQICSNGALVASSSTPDSMGSFSVPLTAKFKAKDKVQAQLVVFENAEGTTVFSPASDDVTVTGGSCAKAGSSNSATAPTLTIKSVNSDDALATYSGTVDKAVKGSVRVCVNDIPLTTQTPIRNGKFDSGTTSITVAKGDKVTAQTVSSSNPPVYGSVSNVVTVGASPKPPSATIIMIAGYEQAAYSSQGLNGNAFVDLFYQSPSWHGWYGWGNVRLLGAPQPSTQGIAGSFANPQGQIATQSYSTVGQAMDFMIGPEYRLGKPGSHWAAILEFGATTPLSSQSTPLTFVVPPAGTIECSTLVSRFSPQNGYNPGLMASTTSGTCLQGGYTDIAFANQDRSNFLVKYAGGLRSTLKMPCQTGSAQNPCSDSYALLDMTLGQDETVSGGSPRGVVFKLDGELPLPVFSSSWLYLFGSVYMRVLDDVQLSPLVLQVPTTPVTVPSPSVFILPLRQPNRDYFRIGIGLNLSQVFCKMSASACPNSNSGAGTSSTAGSTP
ncbi:MAG TPA: hypothetical protein VGR81_12300 [Candidatus Acidoferrales bacterium]|nr:hypothetical protein [Candidatus Acidoferrales bacterium]